MRKQHLFRKIFLCTIEIFYIYQQLDRRICYITASSAINNGLSIPLPYLDSTDSSNLKSILVLGGSSGIGAVAIQLIRIALPLAAILTTSSAQHHAHLTSLGATKCFERSVQDNPSAIHAATHDGLGVDAILDTVQAAAGQLRVFEALNSAGPNLYSYVMTGKNTVVPEGVKATMIFAQQIFSAKGGMNALPALARLIENDKFKLPNRVEVVAKGFQEIQKGLDANMNDVSGFKCIVSL